MIPWLEEAGYGIVVYDYPFNRSIAESCQGFARDWAAFRAEAKTRSPGRSSRTRWAHCWRGRSSKARRGPLHDVRSLILIAPVNQGSQLARVQTLVQFMNGLQAIKGKNTTKAMMNLSDGLGQAAEDMLPGSPFLKVLNRRSRRQGLPYHIVAGDRGFLTREARAQIEGRIDLVKRNAGILGRLTQAATADLPDLLDELTDGTGDGCVSVERTRLEGVADHVIIHANHAELIRAPCSSPIPDRSRACRTCCDGSMRISREAAKGRSTRSTDTNDRVDTRIAWRGSPMKRIYLFSGLLLVALFAGWLVRGVGRARKPQGGPPAPDI